MDIVLTAIVLYLIVGAAIGAPFYFEYRENKREERAMEEKNKRDEEYKKQRREELKHRYKIKKSEITMDNVFSKEAIKFKEDETILVHAIDEFPGYKKKDEDHSTAFRRAMFIITDQQLIICDDLNSEAFNHDDIEKVILDIGKIEIRLKKKYEYIEFFLPVDDIVKFEMFMKNRNIPFESGIDK